MALEVIDISTGAGFVRHGLGVAILPRFAVPESEDLVVRPLLRDEVFYVSADPARTAKPVTIQEFAKADLVLYDAHYGWKDPTRRQLAERAQLAGLRLEPWIEIEHVESALKLVAADIGDTIRAQPGPSTDVLHHSSNVGRQCRGRSAP